MLSQTANTAEDAGEILLEVVFVQKLKKFREMSQEHPYFRRWSKSVPQGVRSIIENLEIISVQIRQIHLPLNLILPCLLSAPILADQAGPGVLYTVKTVVINNTCRIFDT